MATAKHSVIYSLKGDPSDLLQDIRKVGTSFDRLQANFKEGLRATSAVAAGPGMMPAAGGLAGAAAGAAAGGAAGLGIKGLLKGAASQALPFLGIGAGIGGITQFARSVDRNNQAMQTWRRQFKLLGFEAADVNEELNTTIDFASATILDTDAVIDARMQLKQLGLDSQRNLTAIADTAQLTGISIGSLADTMGRLKGGNFGQALRPLTKFGISPTGIQERAAALQGEGMPAEEANIEAVIEALEKLAGGTTEELSSTIESLKGTLGNEWVKASSELGAAFEPAQRALMEAGIMMVQVLGPLAKGVEGFSTALQVIGEGAGDFGRMIGDTFLGDMNKAIEDEGLMGKPVTGFEATGGLSIAGLGPRARHLLTQRGMGIPTTPAGLNLPELPPEPVPRPLSEYEAVTQARQVTNNMNYTIYSPVGIAPNVNLAGMAGR